MTNRKAIRGGTAWFLAPVFGALAIGALFASEADSSYRQSVEKWRKDYETQLKSDDGWLTVSGLFWLHQGENRFGSDPSNDIVLPAGSFPASAGSFDFHEGKTVVHVEPGVPVTKSGEQVNTAELQPDVEADFLHLGDLTLYVHASGARFTIRLKDKNSQLRKSFTGLNWFPIDESYRIQARYVPYEPPKKIEIQNIFGDTLESSVVGYVTFSVHGQEVRLDAEQENTKTLWFVFRDLTSGKETYHAARFLETELPKDGAVVLDFNEAYNPPCAYNTYTTCPLPSPGNRLRVEIRAGEKSYKHGPSE
jgi:uncharacterized protein